MFCEENREKLKEILMCQPYGNHTYDEVVDYLISNGVSALPMELPDTTALEKRCDELDYKLIGVMHSVDKWLEGAELDQDEVNRAATMREKTLRLLEAAYAEIQRLKKELDDARTKVELSIYDQEEFHEGCTVHVLMNSRTGDVSIGWWHGTIADMPGARRDKDE